MTHYNEVRTRGSNKAIFVDAKQHVDGIGQRAYGAWGQRTFSLTRENNPTINYWLN
jgi:hypothetical protein